MESIIGRSIENENIVKQLDVCLLYKKHKLFSSQNGQFSGNHLLAAMQNPNEPVHLMISPEENVIIFDGHHRTALAIYEGRMLNYIQLDYNPNLRYWPYSNFFKAFKRNLPPDLLSEI